MIEIKDDYVEYNNNINKYNGIVSIVCELKEVIIHVQHWFKSFFSWYKQKEKKLGMKPNICAIICSITSESKVSMLYVWSKSTLVLKPLKIDNKSIVIIQTGDIQTGYIFRMTTR